MAEDQGSSTNVSALVGESDRIGIAPFAQGAFGGLRFKLVPAFECAVIISERVAGKVWFQPNAETCLNQHLIARGRVAHYAELPGMPPGC
jgi:hypothetical protein